MIASLTGRVARLDLDALVLEVGGVGYLVRTTPQALTSTRHGAELTLHTELVVREDSMTLFGFPSAEEAETFRIVQSVSGIGPRTALAVLAVLDPEELRRAVAEQDAKTITRTPGIGPKVASRMLLELGGKLPAPATQAATGSASAEPGGAARPGVDADVVEALLGLGWPEKTATAAVDRVREGDGGADLDAAALLRAALRHLGGSR
ncbi:Holliday junction branch migration protein RuvA [Brachybacterium sp. J144]|uniref:Holliday junction branch migration protein RuvA n=1 Tax=unclassified Brachybacterium TaxID=2623841 RepID=UPI002E7958A6|nr:MULTISPECIES: Holliday junction branch migration protein RuvA [unclassified Brachybacterium]MEE1617645.1 Holliday junction branch migration protein RuvA [Brachybacterium sp. J153]MEE1651346.1 Holliday junction branch migration protein RuvA [Brachybacterium sp. J144]